MISATILLLASVASSSVNRTMSVYSDSLHGQTMANGQPYDKNALTVASNDFPLGTKLRITHGDKSVEVRVTDRMARRFTNIRIDASRRVWNSLTNNAASGLRSVTVSRI